MPRINFRKETPFDRTSYLKLIYCNILCQNFGMHPSGVFLNKYLWKSNNSNFSEIRFIPNNTATWSCAIYLFTITKF